MMERTYKTNLELAAQIISEHQKNYESIDGFYRRAAVTASHKLNREVSEYDIIMIEMSLVESKISLNRADLESYARLAVLASLASQFSMAKSDNYSATNLVDVHESIRQKLESEMVDSVAVMAAKLAPLTSFFEPEPEPPAIVKEAKNKANGKGEAGEPGIGV